MFTKFMMSFISIVNWKGCHSIAFGGIIVIELASFSLIRATRSCLFATLGRKMPQKDVKW